MLLTSSSLSDLVQQWHVCFMGCPSAPTAKYLALCGDGLQITVTSYFLMREQQILAGINVSQRLGRPRNAAEMSPFFTPGGFRRGSWTRTPLRCIEASHDAIQNGSTPRVVSLKKMIIQPPCVTKVAMVNEILNINNTQTPCVVPSKRN